MRNTYRYIYILLIIFLSGAGVARAVGTLNFDKASDAFVIDGKLSFNNPSRVNLFLKQLVSKVTSPFYFNADKDLQFRIGQLTGTPPSYAFIVGKNDGNQLFKIDNDGNLTLGNNLGNASKLVKFSVDALGSVNVDGSTKLIRGLSAGVVLNGSDALITFPSQSLGFGMTSYVGGPGYYWHNLGGVDAMSLSSSGNLTVPASITASSFCLSGNCVTKWLDVTTLYSGGYLLQKPQVEDQVKNATIFGFGGTFATTHNNIASCQAPNPVGAPTANNGCSCPDGYTASTKVTNTLGSVFDIYYCFKINKP